MWATVFSSIVAISALTISAEPCTSAARRRKEVKFYWDPSEWTCFALPTGCNHSLIIDDKLYDNEEDCTARNAVRLWKTYTLSCFPGHRIAVYSRSNGERMPFLFNSALCNSQTESSICERDETCLTHAGFGYCCKSRAYQGDGPVSGVFNFTGLGGRNAMRLPHTVTAKIPQPPRDCNLDGDRNEVEWFPGEMGCLARRKTCSSPAFERNLNEITYRTQQDCVNANFPNMKIRYRLTCMPGFTAVAHDAALIFMKTQCGSLHHSDVCNRDEYCAYRDGSPFAFCCKRSSAYHVKEYTVYGKNYRRRVKRSTYEIIV